MCDHTSWAPILPFLDAHIAHTTVDHGDADSLVTMAERILHNAPAVFDLAGHSMGGRVALEVMRLAPIRVRRLALLGTGYRAKERDRKSTRLNSSHVKRSRMPSSA